MHKHVGSGLARGRVPGHAAAAASQAIRRRGGRSGPSAANGSTVATSVANTVIAGSGVASFSTLLGSAQTEQHTAQALQLTLP